MNETNTIQSKMQQEDGKSKQKQNKKRRRRIRKSNNTREKEKIERARKGKRSGTKLVQRDVNRSGDMLHVVCGKTTVRGTRTPTCSKKKEIEETKREKTRWIAGKKKEKREKRK